MEDLTHIQKALGEVRTQALVVRMRVKGSIHNPTHPMTYCFDLAKAQAYILAYAADNGYMMTIEESQHYEMESSTDGEILQMWISTISIF